MVILLFEPKKEKQQKQIKKIFINASLSSKWILGKVSKVKDTITTEKNVHHYNSITTANNKEERIVTYNYTF